ncbi:MAG: twin-arginine translocase subunit TatC [Propionibacteriaceae bacterium]|nr:twin-arginine translocase subunit TatC [Propionibacteriaceae bacterium]
MKKFWAKFRPKNKNPDGVMSIADHLRELRYRLIVSLVAVLVLAVVSAFFYNPLYQLLLHPYQQAVAVLAEVAPNLNPTPVIEGVTTPLTLAVKVCCVAGVVLASPVWLFQLWRYIAPALMQNERKYALIFLGCGIPLFLAGVAVGYYVLPQAIWVLLSFTPQAIPVTNLLEINSFLSLVLQLMMVFGLGFVMPLVVVGLNFMGVVSAKTLGKARVYVVFGIFLFAAIATPSTDPFSMLALALPMALLFLAAEVVARVHDKRKARAQAQ